MMTDSLIRYAVGEFEIALKMMDRDNTPVHAFDLGHGSDGQVYSCLLIIGTKSAVNQALQNMATAIGTFVTPSIPLKTKNQ